MSGLTRRAAIAAGLLALTSATRLRAEVTNSILVVGNSDVPPKAWLDPDNIPRGYAVDGATAVLSRAGFQPTVRLHPWRRAMAMARHGDALLAGVLFSPERMEDFLFSHAYAHDRVVLVVRRGEAFPFSGPDDLAGRRVTHQGGAMFGPDWDRYKAVMDAIENDSPAGRLRMLQAGRVDVAVINPGKEALTLQCARTGLNPEEFEVLPRPLAVLGVHIGVPRMMGDTEILRLIDSAILDLQADGTLTAIQEAYVPGLAGRNHY